MVGWQSRRSRKAIIIVQFSRASASAIAAISSASTGRRGSDITAACSVLSTTQASGGGASSAVRLTTSSNVVDVYVGYLRTKLEAGGEPRLLHTVRGVGYALRQG